MESITFKSDFLSWRTTARNLVAAGVAPDFLAWKPIAEAQPRQGGLFDQFSSELQRSPRPIKQINVPRAYVENAEKVAYHRDPRKWDLLYRLLWRLVYENPKLLDDRVDSDVSLFYKMEHAVRRDAHKMKAFVRFNRIDDTTGIERYIAWHEPDHPLLPYVVPFFKDRFSVLHWTILTPEESATWDGESLIWGPGCPQSAAPSSDQLQELWKCYYASIFNPARLKTKAMKAEMPVRYWKSMPETQLIEELIEESEDRVADMINSAPRNASPYIPDERTLPALKAAVQNCRACDIGCMATQAVFSEGPADARFMLIGEQPGDQEELEGRPFVGPAGQLLDQALAEAGLDRGELYLTNAVKHFKHRKEGKLRIHEKPAAREIAACKPWLSAEINMIKPQFVICLGQSSALSVFGQSLRMKDVRGKILRTGASDRTLVTSHPAHILRTPDPEEKAALYRDLVEDLRKAKSCLDAMDLGFYRQTD